MTGFVEVLECHRHSHNSELIDFYIILPYVSLKIGLSDIKVNKATNMTMTFQKAYKTSH